MRIICVGNQKGGVGKTTTAANVAGALAEAGQHVLAVDFDPQAQLAHAVGAQDLLEYDEFGDLLSLSIADLLAPPRRGPAPTLSDTILSTPFTGLDLLPASSSLDEARRGLEMSSAVGIRALSRVLAEDEMSKNGFEYDWVVIDTAPKLDMLLDNALVAADYVLAVLAPELQQTEPLLRFKRRVEEVREEVNPNLVLLGILFNKANRSWRATTTIPEMIAAAGLPVLDTVIPMYARLATSYGMGPIVFTAPNSREAQAVRDAMGELIIKLDKSESGAA